jgi:hypothetical protein
MMLLKFDSAFAASVTAGKGFSLTVSAVGAGRLTNIHCDIQTELDKCSKEFLLKKHHNSYSYNLIDEA